MPKFLIYMDDREKPAEYIIEEEGYGYLTTVDSFNAAMMFLAVRRQLSMPKNYQFTIEFKGSIQS